MTTGPRPSQRRCTNPLPALLVRACPSRDCGRWRSRCQDHADGHPRGKGGAPWWGRSGSGSWWWSSSWWRWWWRRCGRPGDTETPGRRLPHGLHRRPRPVGAARPATATGPGRVAARPAPAAGPPLADLTDRPAGQRHGGAIPTGAGSSTVGRGRVSSASGMVEAGCAGSGTTAGRAGHAGGWTGRPGSPRPHLAGPGDLLGVLGRSPGGSWPARGGP